SCTATVGKADEKLGTFYPSVSLDTKTIEEWEERDVVSIEACKDCSVQLACGGGCASVAKNQSGSVSSSDCRPVQDLLELGIGTYFSK
ncbi:MAG: SPASM domain-containing protein, partial [Bacteroidota bacterium]